jgi:putative transposase
MVLFLRRYGVGIKMLILKIGELMRPIRVKSHWAYLYRAIDSNCLTLDFERRKQRDYIAAYHFPKRLLTTNGRSYRLVTNQYRAALEAVKQLSS